MMLKYAPFLLFIIISLQAADTSKKRKREEIATIANYSWFSDYEANGESKEAFQRLVMVIKNHQKLSFKQEQNGKTIVKSEEDLRIEFAVASLSRHFKYQLKHNNPNSLRTSIYHKHGTHQLLEIEQYYGDTFTKYGCLLSAVNLGNIARAEENIQNALAWYQVFIEEMPDLPSIEHFSLFAIGYPLILDSPIQIKDSDVKKLLQLSIQKNDYYVQAFKALYSEKYDTAYEIIMKKS